MVGFIDRIFEDRTRWLIGVLSGGIILLAVFVRLVGLSAESAWIDEAYSINLAQHPIPQIIQGTAADQHPPLYYILLHFWLAPAQNVTYARLFSAILGSLNVLQVMLFGWKLGGERLGMGAALLLALSPLHVWYSQEARQYMLLAVLTTAASIELWNCLNGRRRWWLYWLFSAMALYTQYFTVFVLLAHGVVAYLWAMRERKQKSFTSWLLSMVGVGVVFSPWLPTTINQFLYHTMTWITEPSAGDVRDVGLILWLGNGVQALPLLLRWVILLGELIVIGWAVYKIIGFPKEKQRSFEFIGLWSLIPFTTISIVAIFYPLFQIKQYLFLVAPFILAATVISLVITRPWGGVFFGGLILVGGLTLAYQQSVLTKDDWRGAAVYLANHAKAGDVIYGNPSASSLALDLYGSNSLPFEGYPSGYDILTGGWQGRPLTAYMINGEFSSLSNEFRRIWLVEFFPEFWDPHEYIPNWLSMHGTLLDDSHFGKIYLRLYELNP